MNATDEDKLLLSRAYDAIELSERRGMARFVGFLNEHESAYLRANISPKRDIIYYGGYPDAVRLMLGAGAAVEDFPITAVEFSWRDEYSLRHRDILGALMALGLRRDTVGDILTDSGRAVVFLSDDITDFVMSNVDRIGSVGVRVSYADPDDLPKADIGEEQAISLSSLRLDAFVAAVCHLSRDKAAQLIKADMVTVDHVINNSVSSVLTEGCAVTVRRYGKFVLSEILGPTRKGRLRIIVRLFR